MEKIKNETYILCPRKGNPRKHVNICRQCRSHKSCKAYQKYLQPQFRFIRIERWR